MALIFVDVEARGISPVNGTMTEFGAVVYDPDGEHHKKTFHGILYEGTPDPVNPAIPLVGKRLRSDKEVVDALLVWLKEVSPDNVKMVSDNPAYDFMWIAGMFDKAETSNVFGHSARKIGDFSAGINLKWSDTQSWKRYRRTVHDHNPVNDSMGNVEAFETLMTQAKNLADLRARSPRH